MLGPVLKDVGNKDKIEKGTRDTGQLPPRPENPIGLAII